ncbi:EamA family transporter [Aeromicrobium sp. PE09-221]|uniref:DMT family transporter n=1 Tax=Aeromicrobium sp. PE09-221 TaxID=1898043 RepID=UPI000B3ED167|nr:EamA family transporter [Aeromicrobium sp. PE09-221]OUZ07818.1 EamA family transporter [Aeromicrobium sp. PE09-221]
MNPYLAVLLAAVCFGTTGTALALGPEDATSFSAGVARVVLGGGVLGLVAWATSRGTPTTWSPRSVALVVVGAVGVLAYQPAFFLGTTSNGVAIGTVIALGSAPVMTGALEWILTARPPSRVWFSATLIATAGVVLLSGVFDTGAGVSLLGLAGSLGAGLSYAVYTLAGKALIDRGLPPRASMGAVFGAAAVLGLPLLVFAPTSWIASGGGVATVLWLGLVTTVIAYLLFGHGLQYLRASTVSTLTLAEPLTATLLGLLVLRESMNLSAAIGLAVLAIGIGILGLGGRAVQRDEPTPR